MQCTVLCCSVLDGRVNAYQGGSVNTYYVTFLCSALYCVALCWALGQQCKHITYQCSVGPFHLYQASQGGVNQIHGTAPTNKIHHYPTLASAVYHLHPSHRGVHFSSVAIGGHWCRLAMWPWRNVIPQTISDFTIVLSWNLIVKELLCTA